MIDPRLSAAGLVVGVLVGAAGMGGGSLLTPLLVIAFGFNPTIAVGTDLFHGGIFKTVGAIRHRRLGHVQARLSGWMFLGSAPTSLLGVWLATWLRRRYSGDTSNVQDLVLGGTLLVGATGMLLKSVVRFRDRPDEPFVMGRRDRVAAVLIGLLGGFVVGLTSVGSGVFFALTMLIVFPLQSAKVVGTDIFHAAALLWIAGLGHLAAGNVDLAAVGALLIGSIPGVLIGSAVTVHLPDRALRVLLATVLLVSGIKLVGPPHANEIDLAVLAAFALGAVAAYGAQGLRRPEPVPVGSSERAEP